MDSQDEGTVVPQPSAQHSQTDVKSSQGAGIDLPALSQIFSELAPFPQAELPREPQSLLSDEDALFNTLQDALRQADTSEESDEILKSFEGVEHILLKLWNGSARYLVQATEALANGSRNPLFRAPYGQAGILSFFLRLISSTEDVDTTVLLHSLRLVGNSCADTDENRAIVVDDNYTSAIIQRLLNPELVKVVVPVLYNLSIEYEPAQHQLAENKILYILLTLLKDGAFRDNDALLTFVYELIELVAEQEKGIDSSPDGTISLLIELALDKESTSEAPQFSVIANCLSTYLDKPRFQDVCIANQTMADVLSVLTRSLEFDTNGLAPEDLQALAQSRLKINQTLAEVSASPLYAETYPVGSPLSQTLKSWLDTEDDELRICACVMLGNLARSDEVCEMMVRELGLHKSLISILNSNARGGVLHSALGFLKNLAIAGDNKLCLGDAGIVPAISGLWAYETVPQVQFAATSIARQIIISSMENIVRLSELLPSDENQTYLSLLLSLSRKTDSTPIKTEIGRIVASICRTVVPKSREGDSAAKTLLERLFNLHADIAHPLGDMITQSQWPVVRSEGWFALALMGSSKPGAVAVIDCLQKQDLLSLVEQNLQEDVSEKAEEADKLRLTKDRDNIIVLAQELLKNYTDTLPSSWRESAQNLMNKHVAKHLMDNRDD